MGNKNSFSRHTNDIGLHRKHAQYIAYAVLSLLFALLTFYHLGQIPIHNWDEARHGISAYEMLQSGDYIVNTYRYEADLWNLKPPMSFWMIAASFKVLGYHVLALRIPSALCFTLMFGLIAYYLHKRYGFISASTFMVLFLSYGDLFVSHFGRSADADAQYNLLFVGAIFALLCADQSERRDRWLYLSGFLASLAFLSKSFHAVAIYVIISAYVILRRNVDSVHVYIKLAIISVLPVLIWTVLRFYADGFGFLGSMFSVDVVDRIRDYEVQAETQNAVSLIDYLLHYKPSQVLLIVTVFSGLVCLFVHVFIEKASLWSNVYSRDAQIYSLWFLVPSLIFEISAASTTWYYYPSIMSLIVISAVLLHKSIDALSHLQKIGKNTYLVFCGWH